MPSSADKTITITNGWDSFWLVSKSNGVPDVVEPLMHAAFLAGVYTSTTLILRGFATPQEINDQYQRLKTELGIKAGVFQ